jgi:ribosomal protein L11 methyltransferase
VSAAAWRAVHLVPKAPAIPREDWAACCALALGPLGCLGTEERDDAVVAWLPADADSDQVIPLLRAAGLEADLRADEAVEDGHWVERFNASLAPIDVGLRLTILPRPGPAPPGRVAIVIEPGRAFGTGHHESTRLALEHLERAVTPGCRVLDVGTGSGVLALAAVRLGAASAVGLDIDPEAVEVAQSNVADQPEASRIALRVGSDPAAVDGAFDVVVANITSDVLEPMLPALAARLAPRGALVLSGLLQGDRERMGAGLREASLTPRWTEAGEWISACARR